MSEPRIAYLVLRRMRPPLLVLVTSYAIAMLGMTLIPGVDENGVPWQMSFFHAYYFLSYTATTIGFGEIPYPFTDAQRAWVMVSIYLTVIAWFYAIGALVALAQDPALRRVVVRGRFVRSVRRINEPFFLVCGFGDTGTALVEALVEHLHRVVVVDNDPMVVNDLRIMDYPIYVPALAADATVPEVLTAAGLGRFYCAGVVAVTPSDEVNLKIAITSKLLSPRVPVFCQGQHADFEANMASFGTDYIIDPFTRFAQQLRQAIRSPGIYLVHHWLNAVPHTPAEEPVYPPCGTWVLCGFGRFGKAVHRTLRELGMRVVVVEADPLGTHAPPGTIDAAGTEAVTLNAAGIRDAVALVAGTDNDTDNLSIVMTARGLNPKLFVVIRQSDADNAPLFKRIGADLLMHPSRIVSWEVRVLLTEPLLAEFLRRSKAYDNQWGTELSSRIAAVENDQVPAVWSIAIDSGQSDGVVACLRDGMRVEVRHLSTRPSSSQVCLRCFPLLLKRAEETLMLPRPDMPVALGDRLLFCGGYGLERRMVWMLNDLYGFRSVVTGREEPISMVGRWFARRKDRQQGERGGIPDSET